MRSSSPAPALFQAASPVPNGVLAYLRLQDDPLRWEAPRMFNRCAELRRFQRFVTELEEHLARKLDHAMGSGVDEAAFHGEIFIEGATLRFSNFGRMIGVLDGEGLSALVQRAIEELAEDHGYVLIPEDVLSEPYVGVGGTGASRETWGTRFFGSAPLTI